MPERFRNHDTDKSLELIRRYPLATLITTDDDGPFISHLPLIVEKEAEELFLYGHLARANPHTRLIGGADVYVVFQGPHSYISPLWYAENDVPTWNYAVVHVRGNCELIEDAAGIESCLTKLSAHMEQGREKWKFWIPDDLAGVLEKKIAGFKIRVSSLQAKFKLGQQRSLADRRGVNEALRAKSDGQSKDMSLELAELSEALTSPEN